MNAIVITTIQAMTPAVAAMVDQAVAHGWTTVVVGDRKTPASEWPAGTEFLSIDAQRRSGSALAVLLPENHYARKNLGYLHAIAAGAHGIYDTDDDNAPLADWAPRAPSVEARECTRAGWVNAYAWFTDGHVWPRGLPLPHAAQEAPAPTGAPRPFDAPIQQGLANGSPDVDAVWRLLLDRPVEFRASASVRLAPGCWCPFNSQSTWWFEPAFPLLYLPSFVSFRMTDIWRSFIAQRCLWALGQGVVFHGPEVFQDRNEHNLMKDFEQEIPGYLGNERFRAVLDSIELSSERDAVGANLRRCYAALVDAGLIESRELPLVDAWLADVLGRGPVERP